MKKEPDEKKKAELVEAWRLFSVWCAGVHALPLPADPGLVSDYLRSQGQRWTRAERLSLALEAIAMFHELAGEPDPTADERVEKEAERLEADLLALHLEKYDSRVMEVAALAVAACALEKARERSPDAPFEEDENGRRPHLVFMTLVSKVLRAALGREPTRLEVHFVARLERKVLDDLLPAEVKH